MEGRRVVCRASYWIDVWAVRLVRRQIRVHDTKQSRNAGVRLSKFDKARFRENFLSFNIKETVPQTDTGDQVE
jgi:hypothetical protein